VVGPGDPRELVDEGEEVPGAASGHRVILPRRDALDCRDVSAQAPSAVILIRAERFVPNPATAADNAFQAEVPPGQPDDVTAAMALAEMDGLAQALRDAGVRHVYAGGLATDYCVKATILDAIAAGFQATLLLDASRGVNLQPHDAEAAIEEMVRVGARTATLAQLPAPIG
jgi:nicotinamidase-related amidase